MIRLPACLAAALAPALSLALVLAAASGCGSGAVSAPVTAPTPTALTVLPATATLYSGLPTTFNISGGTAPYALISADQSVAPTAASTSSNSFTVVPGEVAADTPVTIIVRDTLGSQATVTGTVKPRTISNTVTVTPSASQPTACGTALCAGGDAEVAARLAQNGIAIQGRQVRFDVISGDLRIITSSAGAAETLGLSGTTTTDSSGVARMRVRALPIASAQTALLQATDTSSGSTQRVAVTIATASSSPLNAQPTTVAFIGRDRSTCANGVSAEVIVFGGQPPYSISQPGTFLISPITLFSSGSRFTVTGTGQCTAGSPIAVVDSAGNAVTITATNRVADNTTVAPPALVVAPNTVTIDSCNTTASVTLAGGLGTYYGVAGASSLLVDVAGNTGSISRRPGTTATTTALTAGFSDGQTAVSVTVNLGGSAVGACP